MAKGKILVIEDDAAVRRGIVDALRFAGFETMESDNGRTGLDTAVRARYDLLLLDLVLPDGDGLDILREVRETRPSLPVIVLTARGEESDRVLGLRLGADDYVVKPFSVKELLARIEVVLRRSPERPSDVAEVPIPGGVADLARGEVRFDDGERCELSERECGLLRFLARNPGRVVSREEVLSRVWRMNPEGVETRTVDMHVARLRRKLRDDQEDPRVIVTVRGRGYAFGDAEGAG
jgi:two-component system alkaline phosphatase synthesis response regulator PhoP